MSTIILQCSLELQSFFKASAPSDAMAAALKACNKVVLEDFGPGHFFPPDFEPDFLIVAYDRDFSDDEDDEDDSCLKAVGLLTLHLTEATRAWELGTMSTRKGYSHSVLCELFMEHLPEIFAERFKDDVEALWFVKRVRQDNKLFINRLKRYGFEEPAHFLIGVLSNEGYIPFDPFDEVLMKMRICPLALAASGHENDEHVESVVYDD